jgi:hypothetical protein
LIIENYKPLFSVIASRVIVPTNQSHTQLQAKLLTEREIALQRTPAMTEIDEHYFSKLSTLKILLLVSAKLFLWDGFNR